MLSVVAEQNLLDTLAINVKRMALNNAAEHIVDEIEKILTD